jgi:2-amino-4-hydroxy-6-hydroxymethyldihydropteridine diphosphokinase
VARLRRAAAADVAAARPPKHSAKAAARVAVALGSNQGDRLAHLDHAVGRLKRLLTTPRVSTYFETEPVDVVGVQGAFLNAAVVGGFDGTGRALLAELLTIELERGRARPHRGAARTLDLDLVLFDDLVVSETDLVVPHPRFRERLFVLEPLAQVAGEWVDPVTGLTVAQLLARLATVQSR